MNEWMFRQFCMIEFWFSNYFRWKSQFNSTLNTYFDCIFFKVIRAVPVKLLCRYCNLHCRMPEYTRALAGRTISQICSVSFAANNLPCLPWDTTPLRVCGAYVWIFAYVYCVLLACKFGQKFANINAVQTFGRLTLLKLDGQFGEYQHV